MRQAFGRAAQILGLLKSETEGMKPAGLGCIKVDISVGAVRGVCIEKFTDVLGKTASFVGLAETIARHAHQMVKDLMDSIVPPLLELEMFLMQMHDLEHSMVEAAMIFAPIPFLVPEETEARLDALANEALVKLKGFEACVPVDIFVFCSAQF